MEFQNKSCLSGPLEALCKSVQLLFSDTLQPSVAQWLTVKYIRQKSNDKPIYNTQLCAFLSFLTKRDKFLGHCLKQVVSVRVCAHVRMHQSIHAYTSMHASVWC